jgi:hypothetical protein
MVDVELGNVLSPSRINCPAWQDAGPMARLPKLASGAFRLRGYVRVREDRHASKASRM